MAIALRRPVGGSANGTRRRRSLAARGAGAVGALVLLVARVIRVIAAVVFVIIVAAIILRVAGANPANGIVHWVHQAGRWLVGPFATVFTEKNPKVSISLNWGLAAVVYALVGAILAGWVARVGARL